MKRKVLKKAKSLTTRIPLKDIDILIIDEISKDISGTGMDANALGRFWLPEYESIGTED